MKSTTISIIIAVVLIGGVLVLTMSGNGNAGGGSDNETSRGGGEQGVGASNVSIVDGKQIIEINAKGGYLPKKSVAKAGIPTIIRFNSSRTFDCSSAVRIPSIGFSKALPQTGSTDIDIGSPKSAILQGTCSMGMYSFEVDFRG